MYMLIVVALVAILVAIEFVFNKTNAIAVSHIVHKVSDTQYKVLGMASVANDNGDVMHDIKTLIETRYNVVVIGYLRNVVIVTK